MMALERMPTYSFSETMMLNTKALSAALLCLLSTGAAFCQQGPGPNPPANVYNDYKYEFFTLLKGASGNLTVINNLDVVAGTFYPTDPCCAASASGMGYVRYPDDEDEAIGAYSVIYEPSAGNSGSSYSYDFIRTPDGKISYYDPPNSPGTLLGDVINNRGVIAGRVVAPSVNGLFLLTPKQCK
jgi:hypothetical protein